MNTDTTWPPVPTHGDEQAQERLEMVELQLVRPPDERAPISDPRVLEVMCAVPRHRFVPDFHQERAYTDHALPISCEQTISQPYIVALMTEALALTPESKVLEIGTGSGYQAAVLAHFTPHVYSIEIVRALYESAARTLVEEGYGCIHLRCSDGSLGWPEQAPFDAIIVTCCEDEAPEALWQQLKPEGKMVIPIGSEDTGQKLILVTKDSEGNKNSKTLSGVRFVPMRHWDVSTH